MDHAFTYSGTDLTGNVFLSLSQPFPAAQLELCMKGKEKVSWYENETYYVEREGRRESRTRRVHHAQDRKIIDY